VPPVVEPRRHDAEHRAEEEAEGESASQIRELIARLFVWRRVRVRACSSAPGSA
jgi:hypothetical protein